MKIVIKKEGGGGKITIPVLPPSFSVSRPYNNEEVEINKIGTVNLIGKPGLQTISFSSFFPHEYDSSYMTIGSDEFLDPYDYVKKFKKLMGEICRIVISGTSVNMMCTVESFTYSEDDGTGDVNYQVELKQYKQIGVRVVKKTPTAYTTKKSDTLKTIAKKQLGSASKANTIWNKNQLLLRVAFSTYVNRFLNTDAAKRNYWKMATTLRPLPKGFKLTLK